VSAGELHEEQLLNDFSSAQRHIIRRPRLTDLLDQARARTIVLTAPAGYGKTTLARQWLGLRSRHALWCRVTTGAEDIAVTARLLSHALLPICPTIERGARGVLATLRAPDDNPEVIADFLSDEVGRWPEKAWLVIDEYEQLAQHPRSVALVERFVARSRARVLVTSRERPTWVKPRDLLYGTAFELTRPALAMTDDEACQVLENTVSPPAGLLDLAKGWPALLGLSALLPAGTHSPTPDLQPTLFDYVADELFASLDDAVQRKLALLSVPSLLTPLTVKAVTGNSFERVVRESIRAGLVLVGDETEIEIHPLCRVFLSAKLLEIGIGLEDLEALTRHLIDNDQWDDAFDVISRFDLWSEMPLLVRRGLKGVLSDGRLATVERWTRAAERNSIDAPEIALARAEVFLRRGNFQLAETVALSCAEALEWSVAAQAHMCAGAAAHLRGAEERSESHFTEALKHDDSRETRRRALWGRLLAAIHLGRRADYIGALKALEDRADGTPEYLLRVCQAKLIIADRDGGLDEPTESALVAEPLLDHVEDPFVRSGYFNVLADALVSEARYADAERIAARELAEAKRFRLNFVLPNALLLLASAKAGLGTFAAASALLERAEQQDATRDEFLRIKRQIVRARLALATGRHRLAIDELRPLPVERVRSDVASEGLATRALAEASLGDQIACHQSLRGVSNSTPTIAAQALVAASETILALQFATDATEALAKFARTVMRTGYFDSVVWATRAHPKLLEAAARHPAMRNAILLTLDRSPDATLANGIGVRPAPPARARVSAREREVLKLASEGLHNHEIARRLFISDKTVKTHLQNAYKKLDVNSRTQAALKAKEAGLLS
jgi:LuxR family maltose regulon positive regulatory protein